MEGELAWKSKAERTLKYTSMALCGLGLTGWVWAMSVYQSYLDLPSSPNSATGSIYPLNIHGSVVYQTLQQKLYRERWEFWSMAAFCCGGALYAVYRWISEKKRVRIS
jgi:hypothetical protein